MVLLAGLLADNPVQPEYNNMPCRSRHNIDHRPICVNGIYILVVCVDWLGMCCDVPYINPNWQIVPPQSFPLIQEFQNFQCCIRLDFCCVLVLLAELLMTRLLEFAWG